VRLGFAPARLGSARFGSGLAAALPGGTVSRSPCVAVDGNAGRMALQRDGDLIRTSGGAVLIRQRFGSAAGFLKEVGIFKKTGV